jgi:hypothetical protein
MPRPFRLSEASVSRPGGTRVVLRVDCEVIYTYEEEARERSVLPEAPPNQEALECFMVEVRLHRLCGGG